MLVDMHFHSREYSPCSNIEIEAGIKQAIEVGLDGICITDHDNMGMKDRCTELNRKYNLKIFVGVEVFTYEGDFLVYGIENITDKKLHVEDLIEITAEQGGVVFAAHPFRKFSGINRAAGYQIRNIPDLTGIEAFNGKTSVNNNMKARKIGIEMDKILIGGSDAHEIEQIGKYATYLDADVENIKDLAKLLQQGKCYPVVYDNNKEKFILQMEEEISV